MKGKSLLTAMTIALFAFVFKGGMVMGMEIHSKAFSPMGEIPKVYTCDGKDISPPLEWSGAPEGTRSFALICDDPDAPVGTWVHWVLYNLPATTTMLPEAVPASRTIENGACQGTNDFGRIGYGGPCPPPGKLHRYFFKLYALDTQIDLPPGSTKAELVRAMEGHILAETELIGTYGR